MLGVQNRHGTWHAPPFLRRTPSACRIRQPRRQRSAEAIAVSPSYLAVSSILLFCFEASSSCRRFSFRTNKGYDDVGFLKLDAPFRPSIIIVNLSVGIRNMYWHLNDLTKYRTTKRSIKQQLSTSPAPILPTLSV